MDVVDDDEKNNDNDDDDDDDACVWSGRTVGWTFRFYRSPSCFGSLPPSPPLCASTWS